MEASANKVAGGAATERLRNLAKFYDAMQTAMEGIIAADTERAERARPDADNAPTMLKKSAAR